MARLIKRLTNQPQAERTEGLDGAKWAKLLCAVLTLAHLCPWCKLNGDDWLALLTDQPQFADRCDCDKINGLTHKDSNDIPPRKGFRLLVRRHTKMKTGLHPMCVYYGVWGQLHSVTSPFI